MVSFKIFFFFLIEVLWHVNLYFSKAFGGLGTNWRILKQSRQKNQGRDVGIDEEVKQGYRE